MGVDSKYSRKHKKKRFSILDGSEYDLREEKATTVSALLITLLLHALIIALLPFAWRSLHKPKPAIHEREFEVEFVPRPARYVEANPSVDAEEPEKTQNYAARSQRAAQEEFVVAEEDGDPAVEGEVEDSQKIVDGDLEEPEPMPSYVSSEPSPSVMEQVEGDEEWELFDGGALNPFFLEEVVASDGEGSYFQNTKEVEDESELEEDDEFGKVVALNVSEDIEMEKRNPSRNKRPTPKPRPRVKNRVVPGPRMKSAGAVSRIGAIAIDAKFSEFGDYTQRMVEAISYQWHLLGNRTSISSEDVGSVVVLSFSLDYEGNVGDLLVENTNASSLAVLLCKDAVQSRAPFGPWTKDMVTVLGERQEIRFSFYYW